MSKRGNRKCVSMRDYEYIALGLYMEQLNRKGGQYNKTNILSRIMFGDIAPIPKEFIEQSKIIAKEEALKRKIENDKKEKESDTPIGGGIFTF